MKRLMLLDASGFIHRAFHAHGPLTRFGDDHPVGAIHGFCEMLAGTIKDRAFTHGAALYDAGRASWRHRLYPAYKANRAAKPPNRDLTCQYEPCRRAAEAFGIRAVEREGYEADDLIATYARLGSEVGIEVVIVTSDKDLMQLVRPNIVLLDTMFRKERGGRTLIGPTEVEQAMGVPPAQVADLLALAGDASDNIPGVAGVGKGIAAALLKEHGDLESVLAAAPNIKQPARRAALVAGAESARLSRRLVALADRVPVPLAIDDLAIRPDRGRLLAFLDEWGLESVKRKVAA